MTKFKQKLDELDITARALAERIGCSEPHMSNWVTGKIVPNIESANKIHQAILDLTGKDIDVLRLWK
jgi:transcriptional regulator with XRE-family HTH domain|tara:strand:+ start:826 stop:1026 length:201 start_codon:yes stop_codon:yes gene_type:complete